MGASACSSGFWRARPEKGALQAEVHGGKRIPYTGSSSTPVLTAVVSAKAKAGLWQLAQLMVLVRERMGSEKSISPKAALLAAPHAKRKPA